MSDPYAPLPGLPGGAPYVRGASLAAQRIFLPRHVVDSVESPAPIHEFYRSMAAFRLGLPEKDWSWEN